MKKNTLILALVFVATAVIAYFYFNKPTSTIDETTAGFTIEDTAAVDRIFIADQLGNTIDLKRKGKLWLLNDSLYGRPKAAELLLRVFKDIEVSSPVSKNAHPTILSQMASFHRKVEIYQNGNAKPTKTWYVGHSTQNHYGTYMLLETPEGKSETPYIMHVRWHNGYLTPMFFTDVAEWRSTLLLDYAATDIKEIKVTYLETPEKSFSLSKDKMQNCILKDGKGERVSSFDTLFTREYFNSFGNIHFEAVDHYLTQHQSDSMLQTTPKLKLELTNIEGKTNTTLIYNKLAPEETVDLITGEVISAPYDTKRDYALTNNNELVLIQRFVFDNLLYDLQDFQSN